MVPFTIGGDDQGLLLDVALAGLGKDRLLGLRLSQYSFKQAKASLRLESSAREEYMGKCFALLVSVVTCHIDAWNGNRKSRHGQRPTTKRSTPYVCVCVCVLADTLDHTV